MSEIDWTDTILTVLGIIVTGIILIYEIKQRKKASVTFTSRWMKYFSISCMIFGVVCTSSELILFIPSNGTWIYSGIIANSAWVIQMLSMSLYQLSRLYYCFANDEIYSQKGYPKCLFIIMYIFGIIFAVSWIIVQATYLILDEAQIISMDNYPLSIILIWNLPRILFILWDVLILILYSAKITAFARYKHVEEEVYNRIMYILHKITILTLYYYAAGFSRCLYILLKFERTDFLSFSVVFSLSMLLMMDHNEKLYVKFLRIVRYIFCYCWCFCCCCCCITMVSAQLQQLQKHNEKDNNGGDTNVQDKSDQNQCDTKTETINDQRTIQNGKEMCIVTVTND